jgi:hypothetical protein
MKEPVDTVDLELQELHQAVAELHSVLDEAWFREMPLCEVGAHLAQLSDLLEQAGLNH